VEIAHPGQTEAAIERHFAPFLNEWTSRGDRGDVSARRREENDARIAQWRLYARDYPEAEAGEVAFACECSTPGCAEVVTASLTEAEATRAADKLLLAHVE
jgi:hypothetical protein